MLASDGQTVQAESRTTQRTEHTPREYRLTYVGALKNETSTLRRITRCEIPRPRRNCPEVHSSIFKYEGRAYTRTFVLPGAPFVLNPTGVAILGSWECHSHEAMRTQLFSFKLKYETQPCALRLIVHPRCSGYTALATGVDLLPHIAS